jgi:hypothetical protein
VPQRPSALLSSCGPRMQVGAIYQNPRIKTGTAPIRILSAPGKFLLNASHSNPPSLCKHKLQKWQQAIYTLRLSSFGCVAFRVSRSVTYLNTLIALALGRLPEFLKFFESIYVYQGFQAGAFLDPRLRAAERSPKGSR